MQTDRSRIKLPNVLQCCLLLVAVLQPPQVNAYPPDDVVRAAIISMLPEGDITADVLSEKTTTGPAADSGIPALGRTSFSIASDGRFFWFWADSRSAILETVRIDLEHNRVSVGEHFLYYAGKKTMHNDAQLQSEWEAYTWLSENHGRLILGQLKKTGQTVLCIEIWGTGEPDLTGPAKLSVLF